MSDGMSTPLHVPAFARLDEYCSLWAIWPNAMRNLWQMAQAKDLLAHVREHVEQPRAAMEKAATATGKSIAIIKASGILMKQRPSMGGTSSIDLRREIRAAAADPEVGAILLAIDSPGGTVSGTADLAADVKAATKQKPVVAHIDDLGASAAYWIASQADRITANSPTALVGSIGTIQVIQDLSAAAEKEGVRTLVFATGSLKGLGTPGTKVTDEQIAHVQSLVNSVQQSFDAAVQKGRGLTNKQLAAVRHGGVLTAPAAMQAGLIDGIQPLAKTINELAAAMKTGEMPSRARMNFDAGLGKQLASLPMLTRRLPMLNQTEQK